MNRLIPVLTAILFIQFNAFTQQIADRYSNPISQRVEKAPRDVFAMFRESGMDPIDHPLTAEEKDIVEKAMAHLPPLHRRVLNEHLFSISFMDSMPNTALTSPVLTGDSGKHYNITFRAGILHETISEWATSKENTCYRRDPANSMQVIVEAGNLDAFIYVLLHEATHVVDAVLNLTPHPKDRNAPFEPTAFTQGIWEKMNRPVPRYIDSILEQTRFRGGMPVPVEMAPAIYKRLGRTPFVSLYAMAAWFEDIAELESVYHITKNLRQPFSVVVKSDGKEVIRFEPMKGRLVKKRLKGLARFYSN